MKKQLSHDYWYWVIWGGLSDEWVALACRLMFERNDFATIMHLLAIRKRGKSEPLSDELVEIEEHINNVYEVYNAIDYGDRTRVEQAISMCPPTDKMVHAHAQLYLMATKAESREDWKDLLGKALAFSKTYGDDYEMKRYTALGYAGIGFTARALDLLEDICSHSNNGMTILRAADDKERLFHGDLDR